MNPCKTGFIVHDVHADPVRTRRRMLAKATGLKKAVVAASPPWIAHNVLLPNFVSVKDLRMGEATGIQSEVAGPASMVFWAVPYDPQQIKAREPQAIEAIFQGGKLCGNEGARIIGLGASTAIIGNRGVDVAKRLNAEGIWVTTGNTYTAVSAVQGILSVAAEVGYDLSDCTAAVIGATGSTGGLAARLLAPQVNRLLLVGTSRDRAGQIAQRIGYGARPESLEAAIKEAQLIITVSSATTGLAIEPGWFKPAAIVCDVARPRDVALKVANARKDVLVFDGAIIKIPGANLNIDFDFGFPSGTTYACMAETMILGLEGYEGNFSIGTQLDFDRAQQMRDWALVHNFELAGYRSFDAELNPSVIDRFREHISAGRRMHV